MTDVLLATDADWVVEEVAGALCAPDVSFRVVRSGHEVRPAVAASTPDLVILDFQIGNMGGMATCLDLRLESGVGRLPRLPVLMLTDREADAFLARRSDADAWLVKPLNPLLLRSTAQELLARSLADNAERPD
ncbi:response regulator [Candidatus Poriferisodalis sp.]|uniref:response regulator n=1 Tax=Candidatus Poriferisodalis sp. TaxID=3101277 RepID=UPI003B0234A9